VARTWPGRRTGQAVAAVVARAPRPSRDGRSAFGDRAVPRATWADAAWFWPLAPLSARAVGAWLLTIAVLALHACLENDRRRVRLALIGYAVFGVLQLIALARFSGDVDWSDPRSWVFAALLASTVAAPIVLVGRRERFVAAAPSS
jgi:hypothetical protein